MIGVYWFVRLWAERKWRKLIRNRVIAHPKNHAYRAHREAIRRYGQ